MRLTILLFLSILYSFTSLCKAQNCESVQKIEAKDGIAYMGVVDTTPNNDIYLFLLGKSVAKSDTNYILSIGKNAFERSDESNSKGIVFLFNDGSKIVKQNQILEVISFPNKAAVLSTQLNLSFDEVLKMKNGF